MAYCRHQAIRNEPYGINDKKDAIPPTVFVNSSYTGIVLLTNNQSIKVSIFLFSQPSKLSFLISKTNEAGSTCLREYLNNVHRILKK